MEPPTDNDALYQKITPSIKKAYISNHTLILQKCFFILDVKMLNDKDDIRNYWISYYPLGQTGPSFLKEFHNFNQYVNASFI